MPKLTHVDKKGKARMVDVTAKEITEREAVAKGSIFMKKDTLKAVLANENKKGDVLGTAKIAGIMAAKKAGDLILLCHPLNIDSVDILFEPIMKTNCIDLTALANATGT